MSDVKIPKGYKQTEVGVIPKDWNIEPLENFTSYISYGFTNPMPTTLSGPYMITARDIINGKIQYKTARKTDLKAFEKLLTQKSRPKEKDILLTKDGTLGRVAIAGKKKICINQSVAILRPNSRINPSFFKHLLESSYYQNKMLEDAGGSTIKHIYITIVNKMSLGVPNNLKEQNAIATALSDVDNLTQSLEKLIAKKEAIKTATMQHLLTGKTRLPEFATHENGSAKGFKQTELGQIPEDWEVVRIIDNHIIATGNTPPTNDQRNYKGKFLFVSPADLGTNKLIHNTQKKLSLKGFKLARKFPKGSTLFTCIGSTIGKTGLATCELTSNQQINAVFPNEIDDFEFTYYALTHHSKRIKNKASEQAVPLINKTEFGQFEYMQPNELKEQTAIATILSDMDAEIHALQQRLEKTRDIKQGMMQQLLTGKVRLAH